VATTTTYAQAYPYTGMPAKVEKFQVITTAPTPGTSVGTFQLTSTETTYCDSVTLDSNDDPICSQPGASYPTRTPVFVYASKVVDQTFTHPETGDTDDRIQVTSDFHYDAQGNSTKTTVTAELFEKGNDTQSVTKTTVNTYGMAGSSQDGLDKAQGKVTDMVETDTCVSTGPFDCTTPKYHHTGFTYGPVSSFGGVSTTALALVNKDLEPGANYPIELVTAYAYDQFGNVVITTSCANDFTGCTAGAPGPSDEPPDPNPHPPYRTTRVSYSKSDFNAPQGSGLTSALSYGDGRFPVKTTNAVGHVEYSVYDPIKGLVIQKTGPNGINTCYQYDDLGREIVETARCGSTDPLMTTTNYYQIPIINFAPPPGTPPSPSAQA
jgi:hypothetical protein